MASIIYYNTTLPEFEVYRPKTLDEVLRLKSKYGGDAMIIAGGTDLLVDLRMRLRKPKVLIDITGVDELRKLEYSEGKGLEIGAGVTLRALELNDIVRRKYPVLWSAIKVMADAALRNRATLVGNLCNASPAADTAPPLLTYKAKAEIASVRKRRIIDLKEFFVWVKRTVLKPDEVVTKVIVPEPPKGHSGEYYKAVRSVEDLALVGIAILVANPDNPKERIVRLAYASVAPKPVIVDEVEKLFKQDKPLNQLIREAIEIVKRAVSPITDVRATKEYRMHIVEFMTAYLLKKYLKVR
ncbi:MAG TPA: xanthine dehydrogenase family protein subunit M [Acidilobales archaeon]|nr:xanthine dehydrogenase family protein subunit M [Acidilobales archaeon]